MANVYVSGFGNDATGDGSIGNPYLTISKAVSILSLEPNTIWLGNGTYVETIPDAIGVCDIDNRLTIRTYDSSEGNFWPSVFGDIPYAVIDANGANFVHIEAYYTNLINIEFVGYLNSYNNGSNYSHLNFYNCHFNNDVLYFVCLTSSYQYTSNFYQCKFSNWTAGFGITFANNFIGCYFENGRWAVTSAKNVSNCIFDSCESGVYQANVYNCIFYACDIGIEMQGFNDVINNIFESCDTAFYQYDTKGNIINYNNFYNCTTLFNLGTSAFQLYQYNNVSVIELLKNPPTDFSLFNSDTFNKSLPLYYLGNDTSTNSFAGAVPYAQSGGSSSTGCIKKTKSMVTLSNAEIDYLIQLQTTGAKIKDREPFTFSQNMANDFSNDKYVYFGDLTFFGGNDATGILCEVNNNTNVANTLSVKFEKSPSDLLSSPAAFSNVLFNEITCANSAEITVYFVGWRCLKI